MLVIRLFLVISYLAFIHTGFCQSFQGLVKGDVTDENGEIQPACFYLGDNSLAFELNYTEEGEPYTSRFIPEPDSAQLIVTSKTPKGNYFYKFSYDYKVPESYTNQEPQVERTKEYQMLLDHRLTKYVVSMDSLTCECWVAEGLEFDYGKFAPFLKTDLCAKALQMEKRLGFPLMSQTRDNKGKTLVKFKARSIKEEMLFSPEFKIPSSYTQAIR